MGSWKPMSFKGSYPENPVNPNPYIFKIRKTMKINGLYVSMINYPNCTNFEGNKILVTNYDITNKNKLDPHFYKDSGLIARFEPTKNGWDSAVWFATNIE